jgi:hypothetical protein
MQFLIGSAKNLRKNLTKCLLFFKRKTHTFVDVDYLKSIQNFILLKPVLTKSFI